MKQPIWWSSLSWRQTRLFEIFHKYPFCRVEGVQVHGGEALITSATKIIQKLRMGGDSAPRSESTLTDFMLKRQMIELLEIIAELGEGEIRSIEIAHGLPVVIELERRLDASGGHGG